MSETQFSRHERIDDRDIWIFDDQIENVGQIVDAIDLSPFTRTERATPETDQHRHWVQEFVDLRALASLEISRATLSALGRVLPGRTYRPYRAYTNYCSFGDVLLIHTDSHPGADEFTALWYLSRTWEADWGGETIFFDRSLDARVVVSPKPGRLALFHGEIPHAGRPPSRICYQPRYTFAIKLERVG